DIPLRTEKASLPVRDDLRNISMKRRNDGHPGGLGLNQADGRSTFAVAIVGGDARAQEDVMIPKRGLIGLVWLESEPPDALTEARNQREDLFLFLVVPHLAAAVAQERHREVGMALPNPLDGAQGIGNALLFAEDRCHQDAHATRSVRASCAERKGVERDTDALKENFLGGASQSDQVFAHDPAFCQKEIAFLEETPIGLPPLVTSRKLRSV